MKIFGAILASVFCRALTFAQAEPISSVNLCSIEIKKEYVRAIGQGLLLHTTCSDSTHFFFLVTNENDTIGSWLNANYPIKGKRLLITSAGNQFFVVRRSKNARGRYQYDFKQKSWNFSTIPSSSWSTGNREDP